MKNIFCFLAALILIFFHNGTMAQEEPAFEFINPADAVKMNGTFGPAKKYESKMRQSENSESTSKEILVDSSFLRKGAEKDAKIEIKTETDTIKTEKIEVPKEELAEMLKNDNTLSNDKEILEALTAASAQKKQVKTPTTDKSGNVYGKSYGLGDVKYFPSRRRAK